MGDDSSEDARKRTEVVDRLCETFDKEGWLGEDPDSRENN